MLITKIWENIRSMQKYKVNFIFMCIFSEKTDLCKIFKSMYENYRYMFGLLIHLHHVENNLQIYAKLMIVCRYMRSVSEIIRPVPITYSSMQICRQKDILRFLSILKLLIFKIFWVQKWYTTFSSFLTFILVCVQNQDWSFRK